mgnify:CR=1 FL=1
MTIFIILFTALFISIAYHILVYIQSLINIKNDRKFLKANKDNFFPSVSILKPLKGIDDDLERNIKSFFELDYPEYEIIFGFHSNDDPAIKIVEKLIKEHPQIKSKVVIDSAEIGLNPKINNLNNIYPYSSGEIIFISDSNTRVDKEFLKMIVSYFRDESVGLVSAAIKGTNAKNIFALFENLHLNSFTFGIVQTASALANVQITIGKAILVRRQILDHLNGFQSFKDYLAEDHLMGLEVKRHGYKVKISTLTVENINERWSLQKILNRHRRWTLMRLNIDPVFYILESLTNTTLVSLILIILSPSFYFIGLTAILFKILIDYLTARLVCNSLKFVHFLLVPFKDILMGIIWFSPFIYNKINWRDSKLRVIKNSKLLPVN